MKYLILFIQTNFDTFLFKLPNRGILEQNLNRLFAFTVFDVHQMYSLIVNTPFVKFFF